MNLSYCLLAAGCASLVFLQCAVTPLAGGSDNPDFKVIGALTTEGGRPASNTEVRLIPNAFNPEADGTLPASMTDTTDSLGRYRFAIAGKGVYNIQAVHRLLRTRLFIGGISALSDTTVVADAALAVPGVIRVTLPDTANGYVYVPGSDIYAVTQGANGFVILDSVPAGTIPAAYFAASNGSFPVMIRDSIPVSSGDTTMIINPAWRHARRLYLNTAPSGAGVAENVVNFPVLVRLTSRYFNFTEAKANGGDIRFTKNDSAPLPYEIERWDPIAERAEMWVKIDTVFGNDSDQSITMYWGNPAALPQSAADRVFDTASGFQGVWHLGDESDTARDATDNRCSGVGNGNLSRSSSIIGFGRTLSGAKTYCDMGNVLNPGASGFTISAWVKPSAAKGYRTIISKSNGDVPSPSYGWLVELGPAGELIVFMATDTGVWGGARTFVLSSTVTIADTVAWHHIAVAIDRSGNNNCRLYIDGSDVSGLPAGGDIRAVGSLGNSLSLRIGAEADGDGQWTGSVDECVIARVVRPEAWIRLCYSNQGPNDRLVKFR